MKRVLIVDHDPSTRRLARLVLSWTFDVAGAASGREALSFLAEQRFDVVLMDRDIPGLSAEDLIREVRDRWSGVACVIVSASVDHRLAAWLEAEGVACVAKPYKLAELLRQVKQVADASAEREGPGPTRQRRR